VTFGLLGGFLPQRETHAVVIIKVIWRQMQKPADDRANHGATCGKFICQTRRSCFNDVCLPLGWRLVPHKPEGGPDIGIRPRCYIKVGEGMAMTDTTVFCDAQGTK
jgi:hypothetical protein